MMAERIYQLNIIKNYLPKEIVAKYFTIEPEIPGTVMLSKKHAGQLLRKWRTYKFLNDIDERISNSKKPWPEPLKMYPLVELKEGEKPDLEFICVRMIHSSAQIEVLLKSLSLAFSCEQYYNDHKQYPDSLDQISVSFGGVLPTDPFSGNSLLFKSDGNGYLIYSVSANGKDDGGAILATEANKVPLDQGLIVSYGQSK